MGATNVFSGTINNDSLTISASQNVFRISVLCSLGEVNFIGSNSFAGMPSSNVVFAVGQGVTLTSASTSQPLDGITISAATSLDIADVIISYQ